MMPGINTFDVTCYATIHRTPVRTKEEAIRFTREASLQMARALNRVAQKWGDKGRKCVITEPTFSVVKD
jgi:hypothetical protein